jgi:hypothetical protein
MKNNEEKHRSNAGRKPVADRKIPITVMVQKSKIVGVDHLDMDEKSDDFLIAKRAMQKMIDETVEFFPVK